MCTSGVENNRPSSSISQSIQTARLVLLAPSYWHIFLLSYFHDEKVRGVFVHPSFYVVFPVVALVSVDHDRATHPLPHRRQCQLLLQHSLHELLWLLPLFLVKGAWNMKKFICRCGKFWGIVAVTSPMQDFVPSIHRLRVPAAKRARPWAFCISRRAFIQNSWQSPRSTLIPSHPGPVTSSHVNFCMSRTY